MATGRSFDKILGPPPPRRGRRPKPLPLRTASPRRGPTKLAQGKVLRGPRSRLALEQGVPVARLIPAACGHAVGKHRQVHVVKVVHELVHEFLQHPLRLPEGEVARPPQPGEPPLGHGRRPNLDLA